MWPKHRTWILVLQLLLLPDFKAMGRVVNKFFVIRNTTFVCADGTFHFPRAELSDDDKMTLLEDKGGHLLPSYMAKDLRSAQKTFVNPLQIDISEEEDHAQPQPTHDEKESSYHNTKRIDKKTLRLKAAVVKYLTEIFEKEKEISATRHHDIPFVLPQRLGLKSSYFSQDLEVNTTIDFCLYRGSPVQNEDYLRLCTTCSANTHFMSGNVFPPVINEALCKPNDSTCFIKDNIAQGECQQSKMLLDIIRKKEGSCELALKNNEIVIVDEWELLHYNMGVGCECTMHRDSDYSQYV